MTPNDVDTTRAEQLEALRVGANVLRYRWPSIQSPCSIRIGPNSKDAYAAWQWVDNALRIYVSLRHTGQLIARSKPGLPHELDERQ